ncbi:MAG: NUDIX hydrolase [Desulfurivibrio sp.]|nr:NUDIX hydrolase [Desulfurivibrio sp.]
MLVEVENNEGALILAAGGILEQQNNAELRIALVHRQRYQDWSLPKGKQDPGESLQQTARREVWEETGIPARFAGFAGCVHYHHGTQPKVVLYWKMVPKRQAPFKPSGEVQDITWLSPAAALDKLSYAEERKLLQQVYQLW